MSANKTPQIHTQGNSKYLPKHVCFAGTVSERERAPRSSAQGQHKRSVPCAHQVLVPPRLPPLPASRIPHGVYTRQVPRPDAQSMAAPPPASVTTATPAPPSLPAPPPSSPPSYCPLVTTTRSPRLPFRHRHRYQCHHYYRHRYHFHHRHRKSKELPDHCSSRPPLRLSLEPGAPCESQAGGSFSLFQSIQGNHSDPYNSLLSRVYSPLY